MNRKLKICGSFFCILGALSLVLIAAVAVTVYNSGNGTLSSVAWIFIVLGVILILSGIYMIHYEEIAENRRVHKKAKAIQNEEEKLANRSLYSEKAPDAQINFDSTLSEYANFDSLLENRHSISSRLKLEPPDSHFRQVITVYRSKSFTLSTCLFVLGVIMMLGSLISIPFAVYILSKPDIPDGALGIYTIVATAVFWLGIIPLAFSLDFQNGEKLSAYAVSEEGHIYRLYFKFYDLNPKGTKIVAYTALGRLNQIRKAPEGKRMTREKINFLRNEGLKDYVEKIVNHEADDTGMVRIARMDAPQIGKKHFSYTTIRYWNEADHCIEEAKLYRANSGYGKISDLVKRQDIGADYSSYKGNSFII